MIKSMTGFGRAEIINEKRKFVVEIKSVNHRYLDINSKMPKKLLFFESSIRNLLKEYIERGKIDLFITYEDYTDHSACLKYNAQLAEEYLKHLRQMSEDFGIDNDIRVSSLSRYPEVFTMEEQSIDEEELWIDLEQAIRNACVAFVESRIKEGEQLKSDLIMKLETMLTYVDYIDEKSPEIITAYRAKLENKIKELLDDKQIDENRIATEVTIYADKVCVDEEIVRLRSHIKTTKETLEKGGSIGRRLDFIAQEMNREANTILSKSNDLSVSDMGINLKTDIEKVREQIQNIE